MRTQTNVLEIVQVIFGYKWAFKIIRLIRQDICRPGDIEANLDGLSSRVRDYTWEHPLLADLVK
jgi:DNA-binding HxlR family transcriptional regulator